MSKVNVDEIPRQEALISFQVPTLREEGYQVSGFELLLDE